MKEITVNNRDGVLTVSSLQVAADFRKKHKDVLKAVENIKAQNCAVTSAQNCADLSMMFLESTYQAGTGKNYKCYELTRDGFCLLVMSFTGTAALEWKLKYIEAFNRMEQQIRNGQPDLEALISRTVTAAVGETVKVLVPLLMQSQSSGREYLTSPVAGNTRKRRRRSHAIIAQLEPALQNEVDCMLLSDRYTFKQVKELLADHGISISVSAIGNYSQRLHEDEE